MTNSTKTARRRQKPPATPKLPPFDRLDYNTVEWVPVKSIRTSPENDRIYGKITLDESMRALIASIRENNLGEPFLITEDGYILSGHRRYFAVNQLDWQDVPVRIVKGKRRRKNQQYHKDLAAYNPQRVKTVSAILHEALLRDNTKADLRAAIRKQEKAEVKVDVDFMSVWGGKSVTPISERRQEFLKAVQLVLAENSAYGAISIRKVHYGLCSLKVKPLKQTPKSSKFNPEHYRYKNDKESYNSLVDLLTAARYSGQVSMRAIDDPTRPQKTFGGFGSLDQFIQQEIRRFMQGFHRHKQDSQPRHIEVFGEKNTLFNLINSVCAKYYVPFSIGRGFCSIPVWRDIADRFASSGKKRMTLIIISDFDPEGLELGDDAIRSLGLHFDPKKIDGHRIAVTRQQIEALDLAEDFNPAKETSTLFDSFVKRTGSSRTWEVEALPSNYLAQQLKAALEANMNMDIYRTICKQEEDECERLVEIRAQLASQMEF